MKFDKILNNCKLFLNLYGDAIFSNHEMLISYWIGFMEMYSDEEYDLDYNHFDSCMYSFESVMANLSTTISLEYKNNFCLCSFFYNEFMNVENLILHYSKLLQRMSSLENHHHQFYQFEK
jgi:hypothetical protein